MPVNKWLPIIKFANKSNQTVPFCVYLLSTSTTGSYVVTCPPTDFSEQNTLFKMYITHLKHALPDLIHVLVLTYSHPVLNSHNYSNWIKKMFRVSGYSFLPAEFTPFSLTLWSHPDNKNEKNVNMKSLIKVFLRLFAIRVEEGLHPVYFENKNTNDKKKLVYFIQSRTHSSHHSLV